MSSTLDEYSEFVTTCLRRDCNGKPDEVGWTSFWGGTNWIRFWYPSFGLKYLTYQPYLGITGGDYAMDYTQEADGTIIFARTNEKYKAMLQWLNKAYAEGIINPDIFQTDSPKFSTMVVNNTLISLHFLLGLAKNYSETMQNGGFTGATYKPLPYPTTTYSEANPTHYTSSTKSGGWPNYLAAKGPNRQAASGWSTIPLAVRSSR